MGVAGMVDMEEMRFKGSFYFTEDAGTSYDIDYYVNLTKSTSHNFAEPSTFKSVSFSQACFQ